MTTLQFLRDGQPLAEVDACAGDLLIDVARFHEVPLHWRCGQGTCGTCAVHIAHAGQPATVKVGRKERNVLLRAGLIDVAQAAADTWPDTPQTVRLACHLLVTDEPWQVTLPQDS